jgi:hypothetical protein
MYSQQMKRIKQIRMAEISLICSISCEASLWVGRAAGQAGPPVDFTLPFIPSHPAIGRGRDLPMAEKPYPPNIPCQTKSYKQLTAYSYLSAVSCIYPKPWSYPPKTPARQSLAGGDLPKAEIFT